MKRVRRQTPPGKFEDPLSNYNEPEFDDEMEQSLLQDEISKVMTYQPFKTVKSDTTVLDAMKIMSELDIACLMVTENDRLVGMFSERDVLYKVVEDFDKASKLPIKDLMTPDPIVVYETDCPAKALNQMAIGGFRHVPVLTVDDRIAGILGPRRVVKYVEKHLH